jgi:hypothetical protein
MIVPELGTLSLSTATRSSGTLSTIGSRATSTVSTGLPSISPVSSTRSGSTSGGSWLNITERIASATRTPPVPSPRSGPVAPSTRYTTAGRGKAAGVPRGKPPARAPAYGLRRRQGEPGSSMPFGPRGLTESQQAMVSTLLPTGTSPWSDTGHAGPEEKKTFFEEHKTAIAITGTGIGVLGLVLVLKNLL